MSGDVQEEVDRFYLNAGMVPCCAGCDRWRFLNALVGECRKSAPMSGNQRMAMLGIVGSSLRVGAGHAFTLRDHSCGDFADTFDWGSLPAAYAARIGASGIEAPSGGETTKIGSTEGKSPTSEAGDAQ
jgi:hypothetical protein